QRNLKRLPLSGTPRRTIFPCEKGDQRSGIAGGIAVEKVKLACVFEAGRPLDERKAEEIDIEIDIRLDFSGDGRDVMDTAGHGRLLWKTHNQDFPGRASRPSVNGLSRKSDRR